MGTHQIFQMDGHCTIFNDRDAWLPEGERVQLDFQIPGGTFRVNNRHTGALLRMYGAPINNFLTSKDNNDLFRTTSV